MGTPDASVASVAPVTVRDGLAVYRIGHGEPTLVMPGPDRVERPGPPVTEALIHGVTGLGRQVVTFDPPGSGYSTRRGRPALIRIHECVRQTLDACAVSTPVDAIGHGAGGLALLSYALDHPARIGRTVLVGTSAGGRARRTAPGALWRSDHPRFWRVTWLGLAHRVLRRLATERLLGNLIHRESFVDQRHVRQQPVTAADWLRPRSAGPDWHQLVSKLDLRPRLAEVEQPVLVLCGRHDPQYPPACSEELAGGIRGAQLVWLERSGHHPFVEEPGAFWAAVGTFLTPLPGEHG